MTRPGRVRSEGRPTSASWRDLHDALLAFAATSRARIQFEAARAAAPVLARFVEPCALIAYLAMEITAPAVLDDKDEIYAALIRGVQGRAEWAVIANAVLQCGMWPGLTRLFRYLARYFELDPEQLVEEIPVAFMQLVGRMDLLRVRRIAATLRRTTARDVLDEYRRQQRELELGAGRQTWDHDPGLESADKRRTRSQSELEIARAVNHWRSIQGDLGAGDEPSSDAARAALRARILPITEDDTDLVIAVWVDGETRREAASRLGLTYSLVCKRLQRARERLQKSGIHFFIH